MKINNMRSSAAKHALGWTPDLPDIRDHVYSAPRRGAMPKSIDLRSQCPAVYNQGALGSCHDAETEVLTSEGWKLFSLAEATDDLATVNPITRELKFERPTRLFQFSYSGDLHCGKHQSLDFAVTPDHNMLVRKWDEANRTLSDKYQLIPMKDIGWYAGLMGSVKYCGIGNQRTATLKGVDHKHYPQRADLKVPMKTWLHFLGIYLAEGTMLKAYAQSRRLASGNVATYASQRYKVQIAAFKEREKEFVRETLNALDLTYCELPDRFTISNKRLFSALESLGLNGVKAPHKFVPEFVFRLGADNIREFLHGHFMGDGSEQDGAISHYTSSRRLADDLQRLAFLAGDVASIYSREPRRHAVMKDGREVRGKHKCYQVYRRKDIRLSIERKSHVSKRHYDGFVYCAEMPTYHTLVTRRNGKILISGNCTANAIAAAHEFDQMKQKQAAPFTPSRLFIYFSERFIEGTVLSDSGAMIRDGIKSINDVGVCPETLWPYDIAKFKRKPSAKCYIEALKHQSLSYERIIQSLAQMRGCLASGYPFVFGFSVYESFESATVAKTGKAPLPKVGEELLGGHAVLAVGYDDKQARFIVRNSWGVEWGQKGYFTLPYEYLENEDLSSDFWSVRIVE